MARFGILSAMPVEIEGILEKFGAVETPHKGFYKLYEGRAGKHEVILACSGIGKVNAAACTQKLIDCCHVDYLINMGIAGGIAPGLKALDVIIGEEVLYHDFTPSDLLDRYYPFTHAFRSDETLVRLAGQVCAETPEVGNFRTGRIASGDCFVEAQEIKDRILALGADCCEMEGAAVGHVCHLAGVPFLILRSISDLADEGAQMSYEEFEKKAAIQANRIVESLIAKF